MPVEVIKYLCQFKCGHKSLSKKKMMESHEQTCWYNPQLMTCRTCKYESYEKNIEEHTELESSPKEEWMERDCKHPLVDPDKFEELIKFKRPFQPATQFHINPIINCPYWTSKKLA